MTREVLAAIRSHGLLSAGDRVVVAVSGGADSVALLDVLHRLAHDMDLRLVVAHLDHRLRGPESAEDALFTRNLAKRLGLVCVVGGKDVRRLASKAGVSIEMAARDARYEFLLGVAARHKADAIATAHTADDQAETLLLRLARGGGSAGLSGIPWVGKRNGVRIVRPLLGTARREVEAYLRRRGLKWRDDSSNRSDAHLRNRVRHEVIPLLEGRLNPSVREALCRTADLLREENAWMDGEAARRMPGCLGGSDLDVRALAQEPPALRRRVLRLWLAGNGFPVELADYAGTKRAESLLGTVRGTRTAELSHGWVLKREYGRLKLVGRDRGSRTGFDVKLAVPGSTVIPGIGIRVTTSIEPGIVRPVRQRMGEWPAAASLSLRRWRRRAIRVRSKRPGDRMSPLGFKGSRKLQDIFVDAKVPLSDRNGIPVFECAGEIFWLPGYRIAAGWEVTGGDASALQVEIERA